MSTNMSPIKYALKSVPGLADVGVLHGDGDGPRTSSRCPEGAYFFQMTYFDMPNNVSSMKHALKSVPGLADVGDPHGVGDGPRTPAPGSGSKIWAYHVYQWEKLKRWDGC